MPAPGIAEGAILTRFGLLLGLFEVRLRLGLGVHVDVGGGASFCIAAVVASSLALAVELRVLCRLFVAVIVIFFSPAPVIVSAEIARALSSIAPTVGSFVMVGVFVFVLLHLSLVFAVADSSSHVVVAEASGVIEIAVIDKLPSQLLLLLNTAAAASSHVGTRIAAITRTL